MQLPSRFKFELVNFCWSVTSYKFDRVPLAFHIFRSLFYLLIVSNLEISGATTTKPLHYRIFCKKCLAWCSFFYFYVLSFLFTFSFTSFDKIIWVIHFFLKKNLCQIVHWRNHLKFPDDSKLSPEAKDLICRLLCDVEHRLGTGGAHQIKVRF